MFLKKTAFWALAAVLLLLSASCCRPDDVGDGDQVKLEVWTIALKPKFTNYMEKVFAEFERSHEGVKIEWTDLPQQNIMQKLMASVAGNMPPDLVNLTTANALFLAQHSSLASITKLDSENKSADYFPNIWNAASYNGEVYAVPWYVSARVLIYNKKIFAEAGIAEPPVSRKEAGIIAEKVRKKGLWGFFPVIRMLDDFGMAGISVYDKKTGRASFADSRAAELLDWYADLYKRDLIPKEIFTEGYQGALERYKQGDLAMLEAGPQLLMQIKSDAPKIYEVSDAAFLPWSEKKTVPAAVMNFAVPRSGRNKKLACELAFFITNSKNQLEFDKEVPLLPSVIEASKDEFFLKGRGEELLDKASRISLEQLKNASDFSLPLSHSRDLEKCLNEAAEEAVYGQSSGAESLKRAAERWNNIIDGDK